MYGLGRQQRCEPADREVLAQPDVHIMMESLAPASSEDKTIGHMTLYGGYLDWVISIGQDMRC
jgi:hypothetical protein